MGKHSFMSDIAYKAMTYAIAVNEANAKDVHIVVVLRRVLMVLCLVL